MFVRFVVGTARENPYSLTGLFPIARECSQAGRLSTHEDAWLHDVLDWFRENLPVPPFRQCRADDLWTADAVCWFKDRAGEPLQRMWELVAILEACGVPVRFVHTTRPGRIVYEDAFQVVAETPGLREQDPRLTPRRSVHQSKWR